MNQETKTICTKCHSENTKKRGLRTTENRGKIQRYFCHSCNSSFVQNDGFYRMRNNPQKITCAIDLFYRGVSTRKVQEHFKAFYPHNSNNSTIYRWILKFSKKISKFTESLKIKAGAEVQIDEVEYHRRKSHKAKKGIDKNWFIDSVDPSTKFMVASNFVKSRSQKQIQKVIESIKQKSGMQFKVITTDGLTAYENAIKRAYGYNNKLKKHNIIHNKVTASSGEGFNYPIERVHNSLRARTKTFRGFHGSIDSANAIMKGWTIYYNFITTHQTIGKCPYELATDLKLNSENKWKELIQLACFI